MNRTDRVVLIGPGWPFKGGIASHTTYLYRALRDLGPTLFISLRRQYPRWLYPGGDDRAPDNLTLYEQDAQRLLAQCACPLARGVDVAVGLVEFGLGGVSTARESRETVLNTLEVGDVGPCLLEFHLGLAVVGAERDDEVANLVEFCPGPRKLDAERLGIDRE